MLTVREETYSGRAPTTQAVCKQPALQTIRANRPKPRTRKSPGGPSDWPRQWGVRPQNAWNGTKNAKGGRHLDLENVPDPFTSPTPFALRMTRATVIGEHCS